MAGITLAMSEKIGAVILLHNWLNFFHLIFF